MSRILALASRFGRDERGAFAIIFGLMAVVVIALAGAVVDYVRFEQTRNQAQLALDAAVLALQPEINSSNATEQSIRERAEKLVMERVGNSLGVSIKVDKITVDKLSGSLVLSGDFSMPTMFVSLVGVPKMQSHFSSEAIRGSLDMEIAVSLDVTGSMSGSRIVALRDAVRELVDAVVADDQSLNYSKMALIPYSQAVNAGKYATALRGPIRDPKSITNVTWASGTAKTITAATRAKPVVITSNGHGFNNDDWVYINDVVGMTQLNNTVFQITNRTNNTFELRNIDGSRYGNYSRNGSVTKCLFANCAIEVTSDQHGYTNNEWVHITDVRGMTGLNNQSFQVSGVSTNRLFINGTMSRVGAYIANSGKMHCTWQNASEGCTYYRYQSATGSFNTYPVTDCVTERAVNGRTDAPPSTSYVGRNYPPPNNLCLDSPIVPLTSNKAELRTAIAGLKDAGSTSGSLGVLWSWYMLSPNFGYVWPANSRPAAYGETNLLKAAIIMTDGEFNTVHCNGAVARNSTTGSGNTSDQIACTAPNGDPYVQARAYCDAMKAARISIYTVAFDIPAGTPAAEVMRYCASSSDHAFSAANTAQLRESFQQIARVLSALRIAR